MLDLADVEIGQTSPGDFVRNAKQVADLCEQSARMSHLTDVADVAARGPRRGPAQRRRGRVERPPARPDFASNLVYSMHPYVAEEFTDAEVAVLRRYFTNLEGPVFALVNLPEVVKGALFARYSRSSKSLRRLFLDEFVGDLDLTGDASIDATVGLDRADELYQRIFYEYGDDSVAQLGGVHLACEQASNVLTKVLERGRLMSYLEQSTRYLGYDRRLANGHYRFYRDHDVLESRFGARYVGEMDRMFDTYAELLPVLTEWLAKKYPKTLEDTDFVYRQAIRAKALDAVRGLLPASALSNLGIYASGQAYEALLLRMRAHPLPEVREYAQLMLDELDEGHPVVLEARRRPRARRGVDRLPGVDQERHARTGRLDVARRIERRTGRAGSTRRIRPRGRDPSPRGDRLREFDCIERASPTARCLDVARGSRPAHGDLRRVNARTVVTVRVGPSSAPTTDSSSSPTTGPSATSSVTVC